MTISLLAALSVACERATTDPANSDDIVIRRSTVLAGSITRIDSAMSGSEMVATTISERIESARQGKQLVALIPGSKTTMVIAMRTSVKNDLSAAVAAIETRQTKQTAIDSLGRVNEIRVTQVGGSSGPVTKTEHFVDGQLLATLDYDWDRVEGGWLLRSERLAVYQKGVIANVTRLSIEASPSMLASLGSAVREVGTQVLRLVLPQTAAAASVAYNATTIGRGIGDESCALEFGALISAGVVMGAACIFTGPSPLCGLATIAYIGASTAWQKCMNGGEE